jgi:cell division protein ZipA
MQANWSFILNVLLLIGVFIAIAHMMRGNRQRDAKPSKSRQPSIGAKDDDDIVAIRKISTEEVEADKRAPKIGSVEPTQETKPLEPGADSVMMFLLAKGDKELAGYELLQTVLAAGLRFGEGHLFHRHQRPNGQGPVLCSLAAATPTGVFDLQNIGAFSVKGLCLFMQASGNPSVDGERFEIMLATAKQLSEDLDTLLLDDRQKPMNDESLKRYYTRLDIHSDEQTPDYI